MSTASDIKIEAIRVVMNQDWVSSNIGEKIAKINSILEDDASDNPLEDVRKIVDQYYRGKSPEGLALHQIRSVIYAEDAPMSDHERMNYWWRRCQVAESKLKDSGLHV